MAAERVAADRATTERLTAECATAVCAIGELSTRYTVAERAATEHIQLIVLPPSAPLPKMICSTSLGCDMRMPASPQRH